MMSRIFTTSVCAFALLACGQAKAVDLSVWALQSDLRAAAGDPTTPVPAGAITYNPISGELLIACSGSNATIFEWQQSATTGTVLVPRANWGPAGSPLPYSCEYIPSRGAYMVADGQTGNEHVLEVTPGVAGQTPPVFLDLLADPGRPVGGMVQDGTYAYYKYQVTLPPDRAIHRFTLVGTNGLDSEYIPFSAFTDITDGTGPGLQFAVDSSNTLYVPVRTVSRSDPTRGIYRWDPNAGTAGQLIPVILHNDIVAETGETLIQIGGLAFDEQDNLYFDELYGASILKLDGRGNLSTFIRDSEVRAFMGDPSMSLSASYMTVVGNQLVFTTGNVSGHVLAARIPLVDPVMVTIPGTDHELNGPTYTYHIGKYEITNAQYCAFLNNAELVQQTNPADPRCTNMWFYPYSDYVGDVFMTDVTVFSPTPNSDWYDRTLYKTSDFPDSKIKYDDLQPYGSRFYVLGGFEDHPVGTVSWYGAAKFCNWLTIEHGIDASEICYHEGTSKHDWYAITASDFSSNGLLESERLDLVRNYRGFRLPMDGVNYDYGGPQVSWSWNMDANPYNEWYKAAAFDPAAPDTVRDGPGDYEVVQPDHWIFGYGADTNTNADANLGDHGFPYPFHETTPVGFYDGVNTLFDGTPTNDTRNQYGLYDMCGNMAEWINDTALEDPWGPTYRCTRGGHWNQSDIKYNTNSVRIITGARYAVENSVGFRVARSPGYADFDGDGDADLDDYIFFASAMTGPVSTVAPGAGHEACDYDGDGHVDLSDFAKFQAVCGQAP